VGIRVWTFQFTDRRDLDSPFWRAWYPLDRRNLPIEFVRIGHLSNDKLCQY